MAGNWAVNYDVELHPPVCHGVYSMFIVMSNEMNTPKVLYCPTEIITMTHSQSMTWVGHRLVGVSGYTNDDNVSYFVGVDADESGASVTVGSRMLLTGDRFMGWGDCNVPPATNIFEQAIAGQ